MYLYANYVVTINIAKKKKKKNSRRLSIPTQSI